MPQDGRGACRLRCLSQKLADLITYIYTVEPVYIEHSREMKKCSMYAGVQCIQVLNIWSRVKYKRNKGLLEKHDHCIAKSTMSLPHFLHIFKNFTCSAFKIYYLTKQLMVYISFDLIFSKKFQISEECSK